MNLKNQLVLHFKVEGYNHDLRYRSLFCVVRTSLDICSEFISNFFHLSLINLLIKDDSVTTTSQHKAQWLKEK